MTSRREFLKALPLTSCALAVDAQIISPTAAQQDDPQELLTLSPSTVSPLAPLDRVLVASKRPGTIQVRDGDHRVYFESALSSAIEFTIGGALGTHSATLLDSTGKAIASQIFYVDCVTRIEDEPNEFGDFLKDLYWTMATDGPVGAMRYEGEVFTYWVSWLQDNTNTLKGMKYFWPEVKSNVDFYAASQREDGMVWENFENRTPVQTDWERRFDYAGFARPAEDGWLLLRRAPVENHVEHFLLEAIYFSWKASGDTPWMAAKLDAAIRAVRFATHDPYRWSEKYQLLKRGYTIDTWDFLCESEARLVGGDIMKVELGKTHFGVFFGDNANMIAGLRRLAEMLQVVGRDKEAPEFLALASDLESRLNALSWNGEFFTHWIPEDGSLKLDLGVDINRQVALSNAYSLNRGIRQDQCAAIIRTYQRIRHEMPATSPGEFYAIYPPFERGFAAEDEKWEYMNGGVMSCTAGELAWGAFNNGFESYGVDILRRYRKIAVDHHNFVPGILRGKEPDPPQRTFKIIDLRRFANADFAAGAPGIPGWTGEAGNDLASMPTGPQVFRDVSFEVIDPATNGRRACVAISSAEGYERQISIPIHAPAPSFYLLHCKSGDDLVGKLTVHYEDGSTHWEYIRSGININHWWEPTDTEFDYRYGPGHSERMQVAWRGANSKSGNVGVYIVGFGHPHPEKPIRSLDLDCLDTGAKWMVLAVTVSDAPVFLPPRNDVSSGMPNNWGAAALVAATIEGLAGVQDKGAAFSAVRIAPRWAVAQTNSAKVAVRYPASRGYVRYNYSFDPALRRVRVDFTSSAAKYELAVLLPDGAHAIRGQLDGCEVSITTETIESSGYAVIRAAKPTAHTVTLDLA